MSAHCNRCRAALPDGARFCGACGAATSAHRREVAQRDRAVGRTHTRAVVALVIVFAAPLVGLVLSTRAELGEWQRSLFFAGLLAGTAAAAAAALGELRTTAPLRCAWWWPLLGAAAGLVTLLVSIGYVRFLVGDQDAPEPAAGDDQSPSLALLCSVVVIAPLFEEWLCRGVAWRAGEKLATPRTTWLVTSVLFAFLHGLAGHLLAVPHRLVSGLVYGWLRWRSGSVLPGVVAHLVHNALATWLSD